MAVKKDEKERCGVIYTIEFDKDGNLMRWDSRPVLNEDPRHLHEGNSRKAVRVLFVISAVLTVIFLVLKFGVTTPNVVQTAVLAAAIAFYLIALFILIRTIDADGRWQSSQDFLSHWIIDSKKHKGYKYHDRPGCYVIATYQQPLNDFDDLLHYDNVYVGQSLTVYQRVYNHFVGRGNGKVYGDIKYGMYAYVRIVPCKRRELNAMEKKLIGLYHATSSYNLTKGGASNWK
ncbi:hypothetical protein [Galactobacillus timonensis]|uniref:hypothetical protein n=1 Tax=Galactobacillus timonensis TaxID=2041840 RepID=UPI0024096FFF|nr:hypothetical protein [Galactobacillus timonensis]MDD6680030.1 hypothetical protein [Galactobacillus timonensis]